MISEPTGAPSSSACKKLLVVDDEESIQKLFLLLFRPPRFETHATSDQAEALQLAGKGRFDLAFIDILMPGTNGIEICKQLRQIQPDLKVVLVSGYMHETPAEAIQEAGAMCFLEKPFPVEAPLQIAARLLSDGPTVS